MRGRGRAGRGAPGAGRLPGCWRQSAIRHSAKWKWKSEAPSKSPRGKYTSKCRANVNVSAHLLMLPLSSESLCLSEEEPFLHLPALNSFY
jgi:hypothetical protein